MIPKRCFSFLSVLKGLCSICIQVTIPPSPFPSMMYECFHCNVVLPEKQKPIRCWSVKHAQLAHQTPTKIMQAVEYPLHQLRKGRQIGLKHCMPNPCQRQENRDEISVSFPFSCL